MAFIDAIFTSTHHTKQLNQWPNSSASCMVNYSQLSAFQGIWSYLKTTRALVDIWQASETSHSKSNLGNFHHQYLTELLVNVYSYHLMVKSVSWCCVRGSYQLHILLTEPCDNHMIYHMLNHTNDVTPSYIWLLYDYIGGALCSHDQCTS